ncbi:MAG: HAMP domain-containing sensor histidine kinase [Planctomycetota bacterium]
MRLLRHRTIRTKLLFGVATLSAMTVILATTGIIGFYRYKSLAEAISHRATELPLATQLSRHAASAEVTNHRVCRLATQTHQGMIDSAVLARSSLKMERSAFDQSMITLVLVVNQYCDRIGLHDEEPEQVGGEATQIRVGNTGTGGVLIDSQAQRQGLQEIRDTITEIERLRLDPRAVVTYGGRDENGLSSPLRQLVTQTNNHLSLMHTQMAEFSDHVQGQHHAGFLIAWVVLVVALSTTVGMILFFKTTVIAPFRTLVEGSQLVASEGQLQHRLLIDTGDEISDLADAMNRMADRFQQAVDEKSALLRERTSMVQNLNKEVRQRSDEVIRNEQLAGVGFLAAGFAHEINNPMAAIAWSAESLESRLADLALQPPQSRLISDELAGDLGEGLQRIQSEAFRCKAITEKMLSCSRMGNPEKTPIDMGPLVQDVADMVHTVGKYRCKQLRVIRNEGPAIAYANPPEMRQVILNLISNAMECVAEEGLVEVTVRPHCDSLGNSEAIVRVTDDGCGMTAEVREHLFEPFFTRRRDGTGTGLGLSISSRIVSAHGGSLDAHSEGEGCGSVFMLRLPAKATSIDAPADFSSPIEASLSSRHEDEIHARAA